MTYSTASDRPADIPIGQRWPTFLRLVCDGDHGLFKPPEIRIAGLYDERERMARDLGWKLHAGADGNRVLCPECAR